MKHLLTTLALVVATTSNAGVLEFVPEPLPPLTTPERVTDWSGPYLGASVGYMEHAHTVTEYGVRDITEDQCWKGYPTPDNLIKRLDMTEGYCGAGGPNQHYNDYAVFLDDVVIGSEEYSWERTEMDDGAVFSIYAGYLFDVGPLVVGPELEYTHVGFKAIGSITEGKLRAGLPVGDFLFSGYVGYYDDGYGEGVSYGGGIDWMMTNSLAIGLEHSVYEGYEITSIRATWMF